LQNSKRKSQAYNNSKTANIKDKNLKSLQQQVIGHTSKTATIKRRWYYSGTHRHYVNVV